VKVEFFKTDRSISGALMTKNVAHYNHSNVLRGSCSFVILVGYYYKTICIIRSPSQRSVCDCNKRISHCM